MRRHLGVGELDKADELLASIQNCGKRIAIAKAEILDKYHLHHDLRAQLMIDSSDESIYKALTKLATAYILTH